MSLEAALERNSDLMEKHNELLAKVLGAAGTKSDTADAGAAAPKTTGKKAAAAKGGDDVATAFTALKVDLAAWLGEFAKAEDKDNPEGTHPEVTARKAALAKVFSNPKLAVKKLPEIESDAAKIAVLTTWLNETAKKADKGFGIGRLAADPEPADDETGDAEDDDGMGV